MRINSKTFYRGIPEPDCPQLPLILRSVGHYVAGQDWQEHSSPKDFVQFFWTVDGSGEFTLDNRQYVLDAGKVFYYLRGERHILKSLCSRWEYRWFTFDGQLAQAVTKSFSLGRTPFRAGEKLPYFLRQLEERIGDITGPTLGLSGTVIYELLVYLQHCRLYRQNDHPRFRRFIELVENDYGNELLNINTIADMLQLHRSSLDRLVREQLGTSPGMFLRQIRMRHALEMLKNSNRPISEISIECGLGNAAHFSKLVKQFTGKSPREFRKVN